jgi:hypothetical protein
MLPPPPPALPTQQQQGQGEPADVALSDLSVAEQAAAMAVADATVAALELGSGGPASDVSAAPVNAAPLAVQDGSAATELIAALEDLVIDGELVGAVAGDDSQLGTVVSAGETSIAAQQTDILAAAAAASQ